MKVLDIYVYTRQCNRKLFIASPFYFFESMKIEKLCTTKRKNKLTKIVTVLILVFTILGYFNDLVGTYEFLSPQEPIIITETETVYRTPITVSEKTTTTTTLTARVIRSENNTLIQSSIN